MIEKTFLRGAWHYNMEDIEEAICHSAGPCQFRLLLPQTKFHTVDDKWMSQTNVLQFLEWYAETAPSSYLYTINELAKAVKKDQKKSRAVAKKWRWHIAYRQEYKCAHCKELLDPDAFDVDHVEELQDGGIDEIANLQALCCCCHAKKTRSHGRRKRKRKTFKKH